MSAVINSNSDAGTSHGNSIGVDIKPTLLAKIEGHLARVNDVVLLLREDGIWTASDDRSVRLYLKRDNGQFWPSIHHVMPVAPTKILYSEETNKLIVGLLNGHVYEFHVAEDLNSLAEVRKWTVHAGPVSGLALAVTQELVFSCAKDKSLIWHCSETGVKTGAFHCDSSCTALVVDLPFIFVGDHAGHVLVLRLVDTTAQLISKLSAHTNSISSLAWDRVHQILFSGSHDNLVIMWDIGGKKGEAYEFNAHTSKILCLQQASQRLFSADDSGRLVCWDMSVKRMETPPWKTSDACQLCNAPFFWNLSQMWQRKVVGLRQHHCRTCGAAVCASCCKNWTVYPPMGYELPVRICVTCHDKMTQNPNHFNLTALAVQHEMRTGINAMHLQETSGRLVTAGANRTIMLWDVHDLLASARTGH